MLRHFPSFLGWLVIGLLAWAVVETADAESRTDTEAFHRHARYLASDALEGRFPGTPGGERAAEYLARAFERIGLVPAGDGGGYRQGVPLFGTRPRSARLSYRTGDAGWVEVPDTSCCVWTARAEPEMRVEGELVFAGYGVSDPKRGWDHLGPGSLEGKILVILEGLPARAVEELPGEPRGHYERQETKLRIAAARGARAVVFLESPEKERAYGNCTERQGFEQLHAAWDAREPAAAVWLSGAATRRLVAAAGRSFAELAARAEGPRHSAEPFGARMRLVVRQEVRTFTASNVIGRLPGRRPEAPAVLVSAHYDALGVGPPDEDGDRNYNGARDNAAGTAGLLVLAEALVRAGEPLDRDVVFIATTAEEAGFDHLGARRFVESSGIRSETAAIVLNLDGVNVIAPTADFLVLPAGVTDAESTLADLARPLGMVPATTSWQAGLRFSFDTAEFLERGVPALTLWQGSKYRGISQEEYRRRSGHAKIHRPSDEYEENWDDAAIDQHLGFYLAAVRHFASVRVEVPAVLPAGAFEPRIEARRTGD